MSQYIVTVLVSERPDKKTKCQDSLVKTVVEAKTEKEAKVLGLIQVEKSMPKNMFLGFERDLAPIGVSVIPR